MPGLTRRALTGGLIGLAATRGAAAADWPIRTITIMHGFPPGGPSDVVARIIADGLSRALGQSVIVESRTGASGTIAAAQVARAAPDGYTLLNIPSGHPTAAVTFAKLPFRPVADFSMITLASTYSYVMSVPSATGIKSVAELIEAARRRATPLVYGTPGTGSGPHLAIELFALTTKIKVQHVPFRGSAPAVTELIAGRLDFMMDPPATMMQFIRDGRLRALAVSSAKRYFALPDTPTLAEAGVPGFDVTGWQGLIGPAGLPAPIVDRLNREVTRILLEPAAVEQLHAFGNEPAPCSPDEFKKRIESDIAKWTGVVEQIHFQKI
ncbi:MAG TPA: tripartite tricarboxylate transporter substrate binding protein [Xanthobacteraceae bacterium]|nr:tripartite tricarboxylate transporter substrate binding protein [Xanthobacteraceae bacterium]